MDVLSTIINAAVIAVVGGLLGRYGKSRFDALEGRVHRLEERLDASINAVRSDLTQVALAVGARRPASNR
jgi:hypothetical protein